MYTASEQAETKYEQHQLDMLLWRFYDLLWQADAHEKAYEKRPCRAPETGGPRSESSEISRMKIFQRIWSRPIVHRTETRQDGKKRQKTGGV
jgi:hypothetical protein